MTIKWREMVRGVTLTASAASQYTTPMLTAASIQAATVYNPTGSPVIVSIYKVPTGLAADATTLIGTRSVAAGVTNQLIDIINHKLEAGTQLYAVGLALTLNISGVEYIPD